MTMAHTPITSNMTTPNITAAFHPHPWQLPVLQDKAFTVLLTGSAGGGKSRVAAEKIHAFQLYYPGATGLVLRKAREYASKSVVPFMLRQVIGDSTVVQYRKQAGLFEYANGSSLYIGGMKNDEQREGIRSMGADGSFDFVWMEEANAFSEDDFNEVLARMRGKAADWVQVLLTTKPDHPAHWIKQRLIDGGGASTYFSGATDNPNNPAHYIRSLNLLTGVLRDRLVLGLWKQAEGAVYDEFDSTIHVIEAFDIPADWRRLRVVDFGFVHPFVCQWWAQDPDGRLYLYREIHHTKRLVEDHAREILYHSEGEAIEATVADHDAEDRATLGRHGVYSIPADKAVSPGIQAVQQRLRRAEDGKPRLFIMRGALVEEDAERRNAKRPTCTQDEIPGYVWPKTQDGRTIKERPVKKDDDGCDAMRYMVAYVDGFPQWRVDFA